MEDLSGNVWEWCATKWRDDYRDYVEDNSPEGDDYRALRGGAFYNDQWVVRCAYRYWRDPFYLYVSRGFRVVVVPSASGL